MSRSHSSRVRHTRNRLLAPAAATALSATALLAGCTSSGSSTGHAAGQTPGAVQAADQSTSGANDLQTAYMNAVKKVLPSVVSITTDQGLGSGVVYDSKGDIVTNAHVVGNSTTFEVSLATGGNPLGAKLVSSYPAGDLAVIRLDSVPSGLKPATFGDSSKVAVGTIVLAMGNPLGLSSSVTQGIVSATGRTVSESESGGGTGATIPDMVQTSAAINPGNSGGALVNLDDEVIGIPTLAATDPQLGSGAAPGIGFALPASTVQRIAGQIISNGKVTNSGRAGLGVTVRGVVGQDFQPAGVAIVSVHKGGAADQAGLQAGDVITKVGSSPITSVQSLTEALAGYAPGQKVPVTYTRNGSQKTVTVTLGTL
ncbi:S1C family serine protease [Actinacidiphila rubida]|uniref:Serine protease, S1-C subfamily, contains C-terminal PDZ domain n=1 Tax=Actinacidiphila rubida TaxID=310780 RepID=A0A1H8IRK8_9ACTN|nr:trypsin-like peptidase domain-containing protein [Actinacidiphila rubida]SEN71019.1 serine protease, S1-C subfamily, contains C-terminal PDZ domain [Actinacidiphila rubida]